MDEHVVNVLYSIPMNYFHFMTEGLFKFVLLHLDSQKNEFMLAKTIVTKCAFKVMSGRCRASREFFHGVFSMNALMRPNIIPIYGYKMLYLNLLSNVISNFIS